MYRRGSMLKTLGAGMVAGMVVGAVGSTMMKSNKTFKRNTNKAMRAVSDFVGNVQYMMK